MGGLETKLHETWADGNIRVRPGESLVFEGTVTGIGAQHIVLTFYADSEDNYRFDHGKIKPPVINNARKRAVENVERALKDAGFDIETAT